MQVEGLTIRRAEPDDCSALYDMFTHPKLYANTLQLPYPSREQWRQRLSDPGDGTYNLVAVAGGKVVGMFGLHTFPSRPRRHHAAAVGLTVHEDWHGKGVGTALMRAGLDLADNWLNLTRLELEVYTDNEAAIRLYERFGFEREGLLRRHAYRDGSYVDALMMARLRAPAATA
jgi:putative acetyltransferase